MSTIAAAVCVSSVGNGFRRCFRTKSKTSSAAPLGHAWQSAATALPPQTPKQSWWWYCRVGVVIAHPAVILAVPPQTPSQFRYRWYCHCWRRYHRPHSHLHGITAPNLGTVLGTGGVVIIGVVITDTTVVFGGIAAPNLGTVLGTGGIVIVGVIIADTTGVSVASPPQTPSQSWAQVLLSLLVSLSQTPQSSSLASPRQTPAQSWVQVVLSLLTSLSQTPQSSSVASPPQTSAQSWVQVLLSLLASLSQTPHSLRWHRHPKLQAVLGTGAVVVIWVIITVSAVVAGFKSAGRATSILVIGITVVALFEWVMMPITTRWG